MACTTSDVSPFGDVDAFKTYHGAYGQDSWRVNSKLTLNYGLRWDWFSREQEQEAEQANLVPGPPARYLIPAEWRDKPLSASFVQQPAADGIELVYTDEFGSGLGKMPNNNFAPRLDARVPDQRQERAARGYGLFYGAFENRGGNPSLGYNYPFQFTLNYQSPNDTQPNRLPDGSLVGLDARERIPLDPLIVNANGLALRGVEFDYKTPRYHNYNVTWQIELPGQHAVEVGYVGTRGTQPRDVRQPEQRHAAAAAGHGSGPARDVPELRPGHAVRAHGRRQRLRLDAAEVPAPLLQGPAVPRQLHAERGQDQRRRLALGRRRRRSARRRTSSAGISRTTSASRASTRSTRWCRAATTICRSRARSSAAGA